MRFSFVFRSLIRIFAPKYRWIPIMFGYRADSVQIVYEYPSKGVAYTLEDGSEMEEERMK